MNKNMVLVERIQTKYFNQLIETVINLSVGLNVISKNNDDSRNIPKGTLFTIDSVGAENVILKRVISSSDPKPDTYNGTTQIVGYDELQREFELA